MFQVNETLVKLRLNGNKIKTKGGMAIAGALQVNTMLEELDLAETDQVMYIYLCVKWPSRRPVKEIWRTQ